MSEYQQKNEYEQQASEFLDRHEISIRVRKLPFKPPIWLEQNGTCGNRYEVVVRQSDNRKLRFEFWDSYNNAQNNQKPSAYAILACMSVDVNLPDSVDELICELGEMPKRQASACVALTKKLRAFFSEQQIQELSEIS